MKSTFIKSTLAASLAMAVSTITTGIQAGGFPGWGHPSISIEKAGGYTGTGAEISAYDADSERMFVVTGGTSVDILDFSDPYAPSLAGNIDVSGIGGGANSIAVKNGVVAIAVENDDHVLDGFVAFYDTDGNYITEVTVGALPDMLTFTPRGRKIVVANEGEPDDDYIVDPEGSVSVIDMSGGAYVLTQADVSTISFTDFNAGGSRNSELDPEIRIFGPGATVAQDLEPEYIAVGPRGRRAWVAMQENNAMAVIDLKKNRVVRMVSLGFKDHSKPGNAMDASNRDDAINIANWPTLGMYQPDAIAGYSFRGRQYIISANEGDARDYDGFSEEERVKDLALDLTVYPDAATLQEDGNLGRLKTTTANGDADGDGLYEQIFSYGARSFSIWNAKGQLVYDSGDEFERITAAATPELFNSQDNDPGEFDDRSDDKGPEPEGVVVGRIRGRNYAFIGLERIGGIMVYDVTLPWKPRHVQYLPAAVGDVSPEGLVFIPARKSPNGKPLLVVSYEDSGTIAVFDINSNK